MKRVLRILGFVAVGVLVWGLIGVGVVMFYGSRLDENSQQFADRAVKQITEQWQVRELTDRADPRLLEQIPPRRWERLFDRLQDRLGSRESYHGSSGESTIQYVVGGEARTTARYVADVGFRNGEGTIIVDLVRHDGEWFIQGFYVRSPLLQENGGRTNPTDRSAGSPSDRPASPAEAGWYATVLPLFPTG